jgi:hypothetical protein
MIDILDSSSTKIRIVNYLADSNVPTSFLEEIAISNKEVKRYLFLL